MLVTPDTLRHSSIEELRVRTHRHGTIVTCYTDTLAPRIYTTMFYRSSDLRHQTRRTSIS